MQKAGVGWENSLKDVDIALRLIIAARPVISD